MPLPVIAPLEVPVPEPLIAPPDVPVPVPVPLVLPLPIEPLVLLPGVVLFGMLPVDEEPALPVEPVLLPLLGLVVPVDCATERPTAVARSAAAPAAVAKVVKLFMCLTPVVCSGASVLNEPDRTDRRSGR